MNVCTSGRLFSRGPPSVCVVRVPTSNSGYHGDSSHRDPHACFDQLLAVFPSGFGLGHSTGPHADPSLSSGPCPACFGFVLEQVTRPWEDPHPSFLGGQSKPRGCLLIKDWHGACSAGMAQLHPDSPGLTPPVGGYPHSFSPSLQPLT